LRRTARFDFLLIAIGLIVWSRRQPKGTKKPKMS